MALIDIETPDFLTCYRNGLWWSLYGDWERSSPLPDTYLIDNLKQSAYKGFFDRQNDERLPWIGFYFGMMHGGILSPDTGALRADVCTLASLTHRDSKRGYEIGRRDCSMNYASDQRIYTEGELLEEVRQIALDVMGSPDEPDSWYYSIGCMLGNMSLQVFTATAHEYAQWEAQYRQWEKEYELDIQRCLERLSLTSWRDSLLHSLCHLAHSLCNSAHTCSSSAVGDCSNCFSRAPS
jgi:hypothetical protein